MYKCCKETYLKKRKCYIYLSHDTSDFRVIAVNTRDLEICEK